MSVENDIFYKKLCFTCVISLIEKIVTEYVHVTCHVVKQTLIAGLLGVSKG